MNGVGEDSTWNLGKAFRLFQKILGAVIADLLDEISVDITRMLDVRRIKNHFTAIGDRGIRLIHALGTGPEVRVHFWNYRKHPAQWPIDPLDVGFRRMIGAQLPRFCCRSAI